MVLHPSEMAFFDKRSVLLIFEMFKENYLSCQVVTHAPVPQKVIQGGGDATETTLTILEMIKEKKRKENRAKKVLFYNSLHLT